MRLFGYTLSITKTSGMDMVTDLTPFNRGWRRIVESLPGAWQRGLVDQNPDVLSYAAVYACVTLIASDIGKLRLKLVEDRAGIWTETTNPAYSPVLRKPNRYQTRIKFIEQWVVSKLIHGNAYALKARDARGVVQALYLLDPSRVRPLVADDGAVYYALSGDNLAQIPGGVKAIPASEIIHDVMVPLYHPLCGVSPLTACGLAAVQGLRIQSNSERFFAHGSQPSGVLTAPGNIPTEDRKEIQRFWEDEYSGDNTGKVAVLGNGLKYEGMRMSAVDSQLIDQLKWTAENVCTAFRVPPFKIGVAPPPPNTTVEALNLQYYSQCLQNPIECIEALLDEGLGMAQSLGTEFDLDDLMRMDTLSQVKAAADGIGGGGMSPDEARRRFLNLGPVAGGGTPYLQQQNYSLAALAKRDARPDPFEKAPPAPSPAPAPAKSDPDPVVPPVARHIDKAELQLLTLAAEGRTV